MLSVVPFALAASLALGVAAAPKTCPTSCPDPVGSEYYLNFDDTHCPSVCPVPLSYSRFAFNGASGWLWLNSTDAAHAPTPLVATTGTGTLVTNSSGWVDFGSTGPGATDSFQFDLLSFYWSAWVNDGVEGHPLEFFIRGTKANGTIVNYQTTAQTGFPVGPNMIDFTTTPASLATWSGLKNVAFQAFTNYNPSDGTGFPATIIFDQVRYLRHGDPCLAL